MTRGKLRMPSGARTGRQDEVLPRFVTLFKERGWLNRDIKIRRRDLSYRVFCSDTEFLAYRINDNPWLSPGVPGWPVCHVGKGRAFHDSEVGPFSSLEPDAFDWLRCMTEGDFEAV